MISRCRALPAICAQRRVSRAAVRTVSVRGARRLLALPESYSAKALREAYFAAAKRTHPDVKADGDEGAADFLGFTDAFEVLKAALCADAAEEDAALYDTPSEEEAYRSACLSFLGLPAETVEDAKRCPIFREWSSLRRKNLKKFLRESPRAKREREYRALEKERHFSRQRLASNTDGAGHWRTFLHYNGGLAERIRRKPAGTLAILEASRGPRRLGRR